MKRYRIITAVMAVILAVGILFSLAVTMSYKSDHTDIIAINDITETVRENFDDLSALDSISFDEEFIVFDTSGHKIYSRSSSDISFINDAVRGGSACMNITDGEKLRGTVAFPAAYERSYGKMRNLLLTALAVTGALMLLAVVGYGLYVNRSIAVPFRRMERFAENIAQGRLYEPLLQDEDGLFGVFTESFDIMREELLASNAREKALKLREKELVASLSHDLKTPLTGIKLTCELLSVKVQDSYTIEKIQNIHKKAEQMDLIVSDLFKTALDETTEIKVELHDEDSAVLHDILSQLDDRSLVRESDIPKCLIRADRKCLTRVIGNIIGNSYKYAGTPIDAVYRFDGRYLELSLTDSGKGVPEDELPMITERFYRGSEERENGSEGNGLGLYIAKQLMEQIGGGLSCSCKSGGLTVVLHIPLS